MVTKVAKVFAKNVAGYALMVAGVVLSLPMIPGPGTVLLFLGLALADWPGKQRFFRWLHTFKWFAKVDQWVHCKFGIRMPERDYCRQPSALEVLPQPNEPEVIYESTRS